jgi:hypothetical protein
VTPDDLVAALGPFATLVASDGLLIYAGAPGEVHLTETSELVPLCVELRRVRPRSVRFELRSPLWRGLFWLTMPELDATYFHDIDVYDGNARWTMLECVCAICDTIEATSQTIQRRAM